MKQIAKSKDVKTQSGDAVRALLEWKKKTAKHRLLDGDNQPVHLQFTMKKIPPRLNNFKFKVDIPHSYKSEVTDVCLFVKDKHRMKKYDDYEDTVTQFKRVLKKAGVTEIREVITLRQLRTEFHSFEARRKLCGSFDVFLNDSRISRFLPKLLGKSFYKTKKYPAQVNLTKHDFAEEIRKVLGRTYCTLSPGSCGTIKVGESWQAAENLAENTLQAIQTVEKKLPGGLANIRSLHLKMGTSPALPIYVNLQSPDDLDISMPSGKKGKPPAVGPMEVDTLTTGKVIVTDLGHVIVVDSDGKRLKRGQDPTAEPEEEEEEGEEAGERSEEGEEAGERNEEGEEAGERNQEGEEAGERNQEGEESEDRNVEIKEEVSDVADAEVSKKVKRGKSLDAAPKVVKRAKKEKSAKALAGPKPKVAKSTVKKAKKETSAKALAGSKPKVAKSKVKNTKKEKSAKASPKPKVAKSKTVRKKPKCKNTE